MSNACRPMDTSCFFQLGRLVAVPAVLICLSACISPNKQALSTPFVRKLTFPSDAKSQALAARAADAASRLYPQVCAVLREGDIEFPASFEIHYKHTLRSGNVAETRMDEIWLNGSYADKFQEDPSYFEDVLVHEMAHVAQKYYRPIIGKWLVYDMEPPKAWLEGIADYVSFKLGYTNSWHCPECTSAYPHYRDGYSCGGAFLLFVERQYDPQIVPILNTLLRRGGYSDKFFSERTGKDLASLWTEFQQTPAFTASAASMINFQTELGFRDGKPPKDIEKRLEKLLSSNPDPHLRRLMNGVQIPGMKPKDVSTRLTLLHYFTQTEGTAESFMIALLESDSLPGFKKGDHGSVNSHLTHRELNQRFPASRSFTAQKQGSDSVYNYTLLRATPQSPWRLHRAWREHPDGTLAEEYPLPEL